MLWSGLGFNFLIVAGVLQYYALINGFWTKANVQSANTTWSDRFIQIYLSDEGSNDTYGNTIVGGLQCALATSIIFAAIGGRAGPLAAALITGIAPILYELNRQILSLFSVNTGGSTTIFEFGGIAEPFSLSASPKLRMRVLETTITIYRTNSTLPSASLEPPSSGSSSQS